MATGQDVIDLVRDEIQDASDLSIDDAVLLRYINRGATEFCATTGSLQTTQTINTDATNFSFSLSTVITNLIKIFKVEFAGIPLSQTYVHEVRTQYGASADTPTSQSAESGGDGSSGRGTPFKSSPSTRTTSFRSASGRC